MKTCMKKQPHQFQQYNTMQQNTYFFECSKLAHNHLVCISGFYNGAIKIFLLHCKIWLHTNKIK